MDRVTKFDGYHCWILGKPSLCKQSISYGYPFSQSQKKNLGITNRDELTYDKQGMFEVVTLILIV